MPKTCYCGLKSSRRTCKQALFVPLLVYIFVKRNINKKGHDRCTFSSIITLIRETQGFDIGQQTAPLKHGRSQGHTSAIHHQNCLPQRQLYILLKLPSHSLHSYCIRSQLYYYMKVVLLYKKSKQLAVQISSLSGRGFKYIIFKCLATV